MGGRFPIETHPWRSTEAACLGGALSDLAPDPGWWQASDGKWYPPDTRPAPPAAEAAHATAMVISGADSLQPPPGMGLIPGTDRVRPLVPDGGFGHFVRYALVTISMALLSYVLIGLVWQMVALSATGRRKRDLLMLLIPIWGAVVATQTVWRYTAKNIYWSARADRPSKSLFAT